MENIEYKTDSFGVEHILIYQPDGGITTMAKAIWDELQAKQSEGGLK